MDAVVHIARQTNQAAKHGIQLALVIGGGNILRGAHFTSGNSSIHEATANYMGMLATVMNGLALQDALESLGCDTRLMSRSAWTAWPTIYPPPRPPAPGERPDRHPGRRYGQPLCHHRHGGGPAGSGTRCRHPREGHAGGWRVQR